jgi:hypothetical protein
VSLENEDENPVDAGDDAIDREASMPVVILVPDAAAVVMFRTVCWAIERVVSS